MARKTTGPRYYDSKGGDDVTVKGERVCLGKGSKDDTEVKAEAEQKYHEIMLASHAQIGGDEFATEFLLKGGSMAYVAELQGTSITMIEHHCGHLREHGSELRKALLDCRDEGVSDQGRHQAQTRP
jgi:hypothetical protein